MRKIIILLPLLLIFCGSVYGAGPVKVEGTVADNEGRPLAYATVVVKERNIGVVADAHGRFSVTVPDGEKAFTLTASFAGYAPSGIKVDGPVPHLIEFRLEEDVMNINTVVVTGTRTPKVLKDVPVLTRVITANDIRKLDVTNIGDLLQAELPSIEFSYSMNQQLSLDVQGFGGTSVLFLVDGERLAGETLDNVDYSRLNMDNVERVEIVKGAASSLYGSNAVGGVVNIITAEPRNPWAVNVNTRYGSHNAWRNGISGTFDQGRWNSVTSFLHTAQDETLLGYSYGVDDFGLPVTYKHLQYAFHTYSIKERLRFRASDKIDLIAKAGYFFRERDYTEAIDNRYRDWSAGIRMNYSIDARNYLEVSYNFDQFDKSDYKKNYDRDVRQYSNMQNTGRVLFNHTLNGGHTITVGGDVMDDYLLSNQFAKDVDVDHRQLSADAFMQLDVQITPKLSMIGGWRADYYSEVDKVQLTPKLAFMYKPGDFALRASYGGGFRAPTLKELYSKFDMGSIFWIYGNPDLKSETSHNFMLSGEYTRRHWSATVSGYYNSVDDQIDTVWNEELDGMLYVNTGHANIIGADANFTLKLSCGFGATLSYAYTRQLVGKNEVSTLSTRPHTAVLRLDYSRGWKNYGFNVSLSGRYMSPIDTYTIANLTPPYTYEKVHYPGYTMWKLILTQNIWRGFALTATVDNLFNYKTKVYRSNSPMVYGTAFSVGLSMSIEEIFSKKK